MTTEQKKGVAEAKRDFARAHKGATITSQSLRGNVFTINFRKDNLTGSVGYYVGLPTTELSLRY